MIYFGTICDVDHAKGLVRVEFKADGITSAWLPIVVPGSLENKYFHPFAIKELVACSMDERLENGVVLGAVYSSKNQPDGSSADVVRVKFKDDSEMEYNTDGSRLKVKIGDSELQISADGFTIKKGGEDLKTLLDDLLTSMQAETHPTSTGPSGPPVNVADYVAIQNRLPNLFE